MGRTITINGSAMHLEASDAVIYNYGTIMHLDGSNNRVENKGTIMHNEGSTCKERVVYRDRFVAAPPQQGTRRG